MVDQLEIILKEVVVTWNAVAPFEHMDWGKQRKILLMIANTPV